MDKAKLIHALKLVSNRLRKWEAKGGVSEPEQP